MAETKEKLEEVRMQFFSDMERNHSAMQAISELKSLSVRINDMCGMTRLSEYKAFQTVLKGSVVWNVPKPKWMTIDAAVFCTPSVAALAVMEEQSKMLNRNCAIAPLTSVATQISSITEALASQTDYIKQLIAPATMLADLKRIAEQTHKSIAIAGKITPWQLGVLDSVSFMVDRQVGWASRFSSTTYRDNPFTLTEGFSSFTPKVNVIEVLPEELEYEKNLQEDISANEALEKTLAYRISERAKTLIEKVSTINKICKRTNRKPIFTFSEGTMMAAVTLGGTECVNRASFGDVIDSLYFIFYENIEHIKAFVTEESVINEDVYQCIFRVKDMRTDMRHDIEHGGKSKIKKKNKDIGESYSHYTGKVALTSKSDYQTAQAKLYDEFEALTDYLIEKVESLHSK